MSMIEMLFQSAGAAFGTAVTHIGGLQKTCAAFFRIIVTFVCAFATGAAFVTMLAAANLTGGSIVFAMESVNAIVEWSVRCSFLFKDDMPFHLFGDCRAIFAKLKSNCLKAKAVIKEMLDIITVIKG